LMMFLFCIRKKIVEKKRTRLALREEPNKKRHHAILCPDLLSFQTSKTHQGIRMKTIAQE
jgi:hypothetical protein